jgi:hypothetical protein
VHPDVSCELKLLSQILKPVVFDPLTVADDDAFPDMIEQQPDVPASIRNRLHVLY